jgi:microsomal dipeptidase-like Zn-dependent dipeptidase
MPGRRLVLYAVTYTVVVTTATLSVPTHAGTHDRSAHDHSTHDHGTRAAPRPGSGAPADGHGHDHTDPATKNALSRSTETSAESAATDSTTPQEASASRQAAAEQRAEPDPTVVPAQTLAGDRDRHPVPEDRYAMAGGCYAMQEARTGQTVAKDGDDYRTAAAETGTGEPLHFQATDLGRYLLFDTASRFVSQDEDAALESGNDRVVAAEQPSPRADWEVRQQGAAFTFALPEEQQSLALADDGTLVLAGSPTPFELRLTDRCAEWPEVQTNVRGAPHAGTSPIQEVRGWWDAHTHGMAYEFLGGEVHCGRPWHRYGVAYALVDCEDHRVADGRGAVLENFLNKDPLGSHDPVGWPTFRDWPAPSSLTHEGTYHKWMERAWRGGLRLFTNLLVENNKLCQVYPLKRNSCDEMDSIRLQAQRMHEFQDYIDAQWGGPGEGWYRIVTDPFEARRVINEGKLAVVMGIETSVLFGCTTKRDVPQCTEAEIDRQLDEVYDLGVRQMELVNKFDNALAGVAGDEGDTGLVVNGANFLETGSFWAMSTCPESYGEGVHDKSQHTAPGETPERDMLFGAIAENYVTRGAAPVYPAAPHCNQRGLTSLGRHTIEGMIDRSMVFDPDHMSVLARKAALDVVEADGYSGVLSSHSWATPDAYPRIYGLGGVIAPYAGDSSGFVDKWRRHLDWVDGRYYFGFGYGADINGLGAQGDPRGADAPDPVTYPFQGIGGVTVDRNVSGERVYDLNVDGVAHYGLYPDWIEDLRMLAGDAIVDDMARGPEAYLQMWERALGVSNDGCRQPSARTPVSVFRGLEPGATVRDVLLQAGQPHTRLADAHSYCARRPSGRTVRVRAVFAGERLETVLVGESA